MKQRFLVTAFAAISLVATVLSPALGDDFAISSPTDGSLVTLGTDVDLTAVGPTTGIVQWAVRTGTCDMVATAVVAGNVAGHNDAYSYVDGDFSATFSADTPGDHCFVFNPRDGGRFTAWFTVVEPTKDDCQKGGWEAFSSPDFRNQGDCVSYVATDGRNPAAGDKGNESANANGKGR